MVFGNYGQGQVDTCRDPARGDQAAVDHVDLFGLDFRLREGPRQPLDVVPVGGTAITAKQPRPAQQEHASADRAETLGPTHGLRQPVLEPRQRNVVGAWASGYQQQVDGFRQRLKAQVSDDPQPA
ncbi:hypothetical protein D3C80_1222380 [compost metagenome]